MLGIHVSMRACKGRGVQPFVFPDDDSHSLARLLIILSHLCCRLPVYVSRLVGSRAQRDAPGKIMKMQRSEGDLTSRNGSAQTPF